jgi:hypothetical protein
MKYLGTTHLLLLVAKSLRKPFTPADLRSMTPRFSNSKNTSKEITRMYRKGLLERSGGKWSLTEKGHDQIIAMARKSLAHKDEVKNANA